MTAALPPSRCVVYDPDGDPALRAWLARNAAGVTILDEPTEVMVEVCLRDRADRARRGWGLPAGDPPTLVFARSRGTAPPDAAALLSAILRYAPRVELRRWTGETVERLGAEPDTFAAPAAATPVAPAADALPPVTATAVVPQRPARARLRLADDARDPAPPRSPARARAGDLPEVSVAELSMLLGMGDVADPALAPAPDEAPTS